MITLQTKSKTETNNEMKNNQRRKTNKTKNNT